jgi:hypothetical protein
MAIKYAKKLIKIFFKSLGYSLIKNKDLKDIFLHEYNSYEEYKETQIIHNKRKIKGVWADDKTLKRVICIVNAAFKKEKVFGLCHGTRNGFEQKFLNNFSSNFKVIGTDISDTANDFQDSVEWDFHDVNPEWIGKFDFIYTNSLDQSWKPDKAVEVWLEQINSDGILIIEHTESHGPKGASEMDPFGVKPLCVPYVLTGWFGDQISISHSVAKKSNINIEAWLYVVRKNVEKIRLL